MSIISVCLFFKSSYYFFSLARPQWLLNRKLSTERLIVIKGATVRRFDGMVKMAPDRKTARLQDRTTILPIFITNTCRMPTLTRTTSADPGFLKLVRLLDADLAIRNGDKHAFYSQFNKLDKIKHVVVAFEDGEPAGCGAIKEYATDTMEIKRMFVLPAHRRKGIAENILRELENWTAELSYSKCILETSLKQQEAIGLYRKRGYQLIPNFGQYVGVENSICFVKQIIP